MSPLPQVPTIAHPGQVAWARTRLLLGVLLGVLAAVFAGAAGSAGAQEEADLPIQGRIRIEATTALGEQDLRLELWGAGGASGRKAVVVTDAFLGYEGGWLEALPAAAVEGQPVLGPIDLAAEERRLLLERPIRAPGPATYMLLRIQTAQAQAWMPVGLQEASPPAAAPVPAALDVGVVGPLEAVRLSDGRTSVLLTGQHLALGASTLSALQSEVRVSDDVGDAPLVTWTGLGTMGRVPGAYAFARRVDVHQEFRAGHLRLGARALVDGEERLVERVFPVRRAEAVVLRGPVLGAWQLSNGPGQPGPTPHSLVPQYRYAYDLVVMDQGRTYRGDPFDNRSYFAWNRSVLAAADGEVTHLCDHEQDGPGYRTSTADCFNNRVVLRHASGVHTAYLHLRQGSASQYLKVGDRVRAGQVIGRVGNSGDSSEPHLHFFAFRFDETGRLRPLPVALSNAFEDAAGTLPIEGVPVAGAVFHFK